MADGIDLMWPHLPEGGSWTELGRTEYTLGLDGSETLAWWEPGDDGEMQLTDVQVSPGSSLKPVPLGFQPCRVYWGSHGCDLERDHAGPHDCGCCGCPPGQHPDDDGVMCVSTAPYYGWRTRFYGEDCSLRERHWPPRMYSRLSDWAGRRRARRNLKNKGTP